MKRQRRRIVTIGLLAALLLAATIPAYHVFDRWSLRRDASLAKKALAQGDLIEARRLALSILRQNHNDQAMLRVLHQVMVATNDPAAAEIAQSLAQKPSSTGESRLSDFREICRELPLASVLRSWLTLPDADRKNADFAQAFATRLIEQGMPDDAAPLLEQHPDFARDPELQLLLARCLLTKGGTDSITRAQMSIAGIISEGGPAALPAFRLLSLVPPVDFRSGYFTELEPWLKKQPGATPADFLLALNQKIQRFPSEKAAIVADAVKSLGASDPIACARWLQRLGMPREALDLRDTVEPATWNPVKADLLAELGLWAELEDWLSTSPPGLSPVETLTRLAIAAEKQSESARSRGMWAAIQREAGAVKSTNAMLEVAAMTRAAGMEDMSYEAMLEAVKLRRGRLPFWKGLRELQPWLRQQDRGDDLAMLYSLMADLDFTDPEPRMESIEMEYLNRSTDAATALARLDTLEKNYQNITEGSRFHEIRATILLGDGRGGEVMDAVNDPRQITRLPSPRRSALTLLAKAYLATDPPAIESLRESIPWNRMIREERDFFTDSLNTLSSERSSASGATR